MPRLRLLCVVALLALAAACSGSEAKAKDSSTADAYTAVLKQLLPATPAGDDRAVVYVAPFADQKAIALETQVDVIAELDKQASVRFVDELSEAVDADAAGSPAKGTGVVLLGPVVTTGTTTEVVAQRYASESDQVRFRFRVSSTADGGWLAQQVEAVDVPPTTEPADH